MVSVYLNSKLFVVCLIVVLLVMESLQDLTDRGKDLGLEGKELHDFIKDQQAQQYEERAVRRQKEQNEFELEKLELEKQKIREQMEFEKEKIFKETEASLRLKEIEQQHKLELLKAEAELASKGHKSESNVVHTSAKVPKMPVFDDNRDDIDSYLRRFERYATSQKWHKENWATNLSALLQGKALDVYALLSVDQSGDYDVLKTALLHRFERTEDGFRQRFRACRPESTETFQQFRVRLCSYFNRWLELSSVPKTYDGMIDLMIRDQFLSVCGRDLLLFLKERTQKSSESMSQIADQYREARRVNAASLVNTGKKQPVKPTGPTKTVESSQPPASTGNKFTKDRKCYKCGKHGHIASECKSKSSVAAFTENEEEFESNEDYPSTCGACVSFTPTTTYVTSSAQNQLSASCGVSKGTSRMPALSGKLGENVVTVLRDTGCSGVVVRRSLVNDSQLTGNSRDCTLADGSVVAALLAKVYVDTPFYSGKVDAWCLPNPMYDVIIGNIPGARGPYDPDPEWRLISAVETRSKAKQSKKPVPLKVPEPIAGDTTPEELRQAQNDDETLSKVRQLADGPQTQGKSTFYRKHGIIYRKFQSSTVESGKKFTQLVVPRTLRLQVMKLAHESLMSGHLGTERTLSKVLSEFFWPGVQADVRRFCRSCDICQRTTPKGKTGKVPLGQMPLIDEPFRRIAVDLVGPIQPASDSGKRYILTVVDFATRYPEAVALKGIEAETVAEALVSIFCRVGVPREMLTDMGSQFTSSLMAEVSRLVSLKQLTTTPYHPQCNGLVEKFNGSLKQMLKRMCSERPRDWDKYIDAALFAYRDTPQQSVGFSPFELVYGRTVRGPMTILRELWSKDISDPEIKSTYQYVIDLREKLEDTCKMAKENLERASRRYRTYFNRKAKDRNMSVGEKVLVLLPTSNNKLLLQWKGPYQIVEKFGKMDYKIHVDGKLKTFHANMLKKYIERTKDDLSVSKDVLGAVNVAVIDIPEDQEDVGTLEDSPVLQSEEGPKEVNISPELEQDEYRAISDMLSEYSDVLSDLPGRTTLAEHHINLTSNDPVRMKPYPLPFTMKEVVSDEVRKMLQMGIIESSDSPYSSPILVVKKKDGTNRFCIDFRAVNRITVFDAETIPNADEIFAQLAGCKYVSKFDLCKGYWQLPMEESAKPITAFQTPEGLFQFVVMPFGLVNSSASFSRLMRKLLNGMNSVENFIDDIIVYTKSFQEHIQIVRELLERLRSAKLTAKPSKCFIGYNSLECLGHIVGNEQLKPVPDKVTAIMHFQRPETKKQVKSFLGLVGYYRNFIPNFSVIALPLTDLTKKGKPNRVVWTSAQEKLIQHSSKCINCVPNLEIT